VDSYLIVADEELHCRSYIRFALKDEACSQSFAVLRQLTEWLNLVSLHTACTFSCGNIYTSHKEIYESSEIFRKKYSVITLLFDLVFSQMVTATIDYALRNSICLRFSPNGLTLWRRMSAGFLSWIGGWAWVGQLHRPETTRRWL
jgi:hypothetical protein